jgi:FAD/FMN-containing dehydrogenase
VQPSGAADVRTAVNFARDSGLLLAVKCGGHSPGGKSTCDGGMMIDLTTFRHARVNPLTRTAYVAGGSLLGELDHEALSFGLVTTAGTVSHTGVGGLTLGGGFGRLARRFGLALDNVTAVDIVTADGRLLQAGAKENQDLYWGVRGGGGNFGVVTSFEFKLHSMHRQVVGGNVVFSLSDLRDTLRFYADYCASAPDELYMDYLAVLPPDKSEGYISIHTCYSGPQSRADKILAPVLKAGTVKSNGIGAIDYEVIQRSGDQADLRNQGQYLKSGFTKTIDEKLIDAILAGLEPDTDRTTMIYFQQCGGAVSRIPVSATAFAHRYAQQNLILNVTSAIEMDSKPHVAYARKYWATLEPSTEGYYTNEVANESQRNIDANYGPNFSRLLALKKKYDPGNLFRLNANIDPTEVRPAEVSVQARVGDAAFAQ